MENPIYTYNCDAKNPIYNGGYGYVIACSTDDNTNKIFLKLPLTNYNIYKKRSIFKFDRNELFLKIKQLIDDKGGDMHNMTIESAKRSLEEEIKLFEHLNKNNYENCNNIVKKLDTDKIDKNILASNEKYLALEYCNGGNLEDYVFKKKYSIKDVLQQIFNGLEFLYKCKVIHLNLKPENILVNNENNKDIFKITDFGVSKIVNDKLDKHEVNPGTITYKPPRIFGTTTYFNDLYAFYCIIYFLYNRRIFNSIYKPNNRKMMTDITDYMNNLTQVFITMQTDLKRMQRIMFTDSDSIDNDYKYYENKYTEIKTEINNLPKNPDLQEIKFINYDTIHI